MAHITHATHTKFRKLVFKPTLRGPPFYVPPSPAVTRSYDRKMSGMIKIIVNGQPREAPSGATLADLIQELGLAKAACAAEVNKVLVRRGDREARTVAEGDVIEVVTLVGGG